MFQEAYARAWEEYNRKVAAYYERLALIARIKGQNAEIDKKLVDLEVSKQRTEAQMIDAERARNEQVKARIRQEALDKMPEKFKVQILAASASGGGGGQVEVDLAAIDQAVGGFEPWANALLSDGKILFWYIGSECGSKLDFYKDFYYAGITYDNYAITHQLKLVKKERILH